MIRREPGLAGQGSRCKAPCGAPLQGCGHVCQTPCSKCPARQQGGSHGRCKVLCRRQLALCGHECMAPCCEHVDIGTGDGGERQQQHPPCENRCLVRCAHSKCDKPCSEPCTACAEPCRWTCIHQGACMAPCGAPCDRLPCNEPCARTLRCGHPCPGLCGEKCPTACPACDPELGQRAVLDLLVTGTCASDYDGSEGPLIFLECGHPCTMALLDRHTGLLQVDEEPQAGGVPRERHSSDVHEVHADTGAFLGLKPLPMVPPKLAVCPQCRAHTVTRVFRYGRPTRLALMGIMERKFVLSSNLKTSAMGAALESLSSRLEALRAVQPMPQQGWEQLRKEVEAELVKARAWAEGLVNPVFQLNAKIMGYRARQLELHKEAGTAASLPSEAVVLAPMPSDRGPEVKAAEVVAAFELLMARLTLCGTRAGPGPGAAIGEAQRLFASARDRLGRARELAAGSRASVLVRRIEAEIAEAYCIQVLEEIKHREAQRLAAVDMDLQTRKREWMEALGRAQELVQPAADDPVAARAARILERILKVRLSHRPFPLSRSDIGGRARGSLHVGAQGRRGDDGRGRGPAGLPQRPLECRPAQPRLHGERPRLPVPQRPHVLHRRLRWPKPGGFPGSFPRSLFNKR